MKVREYVGTGDKMCLWREDKFAQMKWAMRRISGQAIWRRDVISTFCRRIFSNVFEPNISLPKRSNERRRSGISRDVAYRNSPC